jgi:hypothetical protein
VFLDCDIQPQSKIPEPHSGQDLGSLQKPLAKPSIHHTSPWGALSTAELHLLLSLALPYKKSLHGQTQRKFVFSSP